MTARPWSERAQRLTPGRRDAATEQYLAALEILRRPLLGDVAWEGSGQPSFASVARTRVSVATEALACARGGERLPEVVALVEQVAAPLPFEEPLQAALLRGLAGAGRRHDAMQLYERVRTGLLEELGVDPGPELRAAHDELLRLDDEPVAPGRAARAGRPSCPRRCRG